MPLDDSQESMPTEAKATHLVISKFAATVMGTVAAMLIGGAIVQGILVYAEVRVLNSRLGQISVFMGEAITNIKETQAKADDSIHGEIKDLKRSLTDHDKTPGHVRVTSEIEDLRRRVHELEAEARDSK